MMRPVVRRGALLVAAWLWLGALALLGGAAADASAWLARLLFIGAVTLGAYLARPAVARGWQWRWSGTTLALVALTPLLSIMYVLTQSTALAWLALACWLASAAVFDASLGAQLTHGRARRVLYHLLRIMLALMAGAVPVVVAQVMSQFADEEFFAFAQALGLAVFVWLMFGALGGMRAAGQPRLALRVDARVLAPALIVLTLFGAWNVLGAYQASFFERESALFAGISAQEPAQCGTLEAARGSVDGADVFARLLRAVYANPQKSAAEVGMLALARNERATATEFRQRLLLEAQQQAFTQPMGSVKWGQYEAALRVYYFAKVRAQFPDLFSADDERVLRAWFAAINRRALTVEWVDLSYALAFGEWPLGPYENQENGAGLLAILETTGLADPALAARNRAYLDANPRGWAMRFHNTDDAYFYQAHWITNALFQAQYAPARVSAQNRRLAFEWLLQQARPDGQPTVYNFPYAIWPAATFYLGAQLLNDPRYLWLAARSLAHLEAQRGFLNAQPGVEAALTMQGTAPTTGACLVFSNSGLPTRSGPLAPDKLVLRDGWGADASFVLLNLRFTGWHRYKATNALVGIAQGGTLAAEQVEPTQIGWLPKGRSALRDKRVPRENLNALLVPTVGLDRALYVLGVGEAWAQDPPHYAMVTAFEPNSTPQKAQSVSEWHGWTHTRTVYLFPQGPIVVIDSAEGGAGQAAVRWHLVGEGRRDGDSLWLQQGARSARVVLSDARNVVTQSEDTAYEKGQSVVYYAPSEGRLDLTSVFLTGAWLDAQVTWPDARTLRIRSGERTLELRTDSNDGKSYK